MKKHELFWIFLSSALGALIGANLGIFLADVDTNLAVRVSTSIGLGTGLGIILGRGLKKC